VIADKLADADIILLMISADFMASNYCQDIELPTAMKLRALPSSGTPVHDFRPTDKGWANIAEGIERVVQARIKRVQSKQ
jgi:hypothetical protein